MQVIKITGLSFLSFLLFILLIVFGIVFMVSGTVLKPKFITNELEKIDVSSIVIDLMEDDEFVEDIDIPEEMKTFLYDTIEETEPVIKAALSEAILSVGNYMRGKTDEPELAQVLSDSFLNEDFLTDFLARVDIPTLVETSLESDEIDEELLSGLLDTVSEVEPELKEQVAASASPVFDYILAETDSIDLRQTLHETLLSTDFITSLIDNLDISSITSGFIEDNITDIIPQELASITDELDDIIAVIEPTVRQTLKDNDDDILDYLLGETSTLSMTVSLEPVLDELEDALRQTALDNLPAGLSQAEINQLVDDFLADATDIDTIEIDDKLIGSDLPMEVTNALTEAEDTLTNVRETIDEQLSDVEDKLEEIRGYLGWSIMGYWALIGVILVLILAIIAIYHQVKSASLYLGIIFIVVGIINCVAVFIGRGVASRIIVEQQDIPAAVQHLPDMLIADVTGGLTALSIGLIILGATLIAASILYPRLRRVETS